MAGDIDDINALPTSGLSPRDQAFVNHVRQIAETLPGAPLEHVVKVTGQSARNFQRNFERIFGQSYRDFSYRARMTLAKQLLLKGVAVGEVAQRCGYGSVAAFSRRFRQSEGVAPRAWVTENRQSED